MAENATIVTTVRLATEYLEYLPDNPFRPTMEYYWTSMTDNYSKFDIASWISFIYHEVLYFGICLPAFVCQFIPAMQKYKIQQDKPESFENQWKCFKLLMVNHFLFQAPSIFGIYFFTEMFGIPYDWDSMPPWYDIAWRVFVCAVIEDTGITLSIVFSITKESTNMYTRYITPFSPGFGFFIGLFLCINHFAFLWAWLLFRLLETVDVHTGYDLPYNPLHLLPFYAVPKYYGQSQIIPNSYVSSFNRARFHDFHHMNFHGNYAPTFIWWDKIFGTDRQYEEFKAKHEKLVKTD
ncbi:methylsterol monooxygenase 1-like [Ptychodera flava]|uniref:methylsterol monooxygenase 1-like n=1 Tax=Ptychodera flava TaxID=63121 RepID=UPI00396A20DA